MHFFFHQGFRIEPILKSVPILPPPLLPQFVGFLGDPFDQVLARYGWMR
jgi:hypothetical protein